MQTVKQALVESEYLDVIGQIRCDGFYDDQLGKEKTSNRRIANYTHWPLY